MGNALSILECGKLRSIKRSTSMYEGHSARSRDLKETILLNIDIFFLTHMVRSRLVGGTVLTKSSTQSCKREK